jgi:hypothetical protein
VIEESLLKVRKSTLGYIIKLIHCIYDSLHHRSVRIIIITMIITLKA